MTPLLFRKELRSAKLIDHFQKLTEFAVEPFKGWWGGRLVIGVREFLNGDLLEMLPHDLLGQVWRNSQILCQKYIAIAWAIRSSVLTLLPFATFLVLTAITHSRIPMVH